MNPSQLDRFRHFFLAAFLPLSLVWGVVARFRARCTRRKYRTRIPVLSVGNVHSGGTGKTPVVMALARALSARNPVILSRGYRGSASRTGARVDPLDPEGVKRYGDEPWMLACRGSTPVFVDCNRVRAARFLETMPSPPGLILLDDGFQHLALERDVDLVLLPASQGPEAAFCLPLGELREPLEGLGRASAFLLVGDENPWDAWLQNRFPKIPRFSCGRRTEGFFQGDDLLSLEGREFGAFCGIGDPESFRRELVALGNPLFFEAFGDHHNYSETELQALASRFGGRAQALLVTTEKDWYRLTPAWRRRVVSLRIRMDLSQDCLGFIERICNAS